MKVLKIAISLFFSFHYSIGQINNEGENIDQFETPRQLSPLSNQVKSKQFPEEFLGVYSGTLLIKTTNQKTETIPMEFHLLATDSSNTFDYRLIYNGNPRNYTLITNDIHSNNFVLNENNGIELPVKLDNHVLYSFFEVEQKVLSTRLAFYKQYIEFEILFSVLADKSITGQNTGFEVFGYPISTIQKATLIRKQ